MAYRGGQAVGHYDCTWMDVLFNFLFEGGPLVFDFGHHALKVGYAGEDCPMAQIPSVAGVVEQGGMVGEIGIKEASSSTNDKYFIGTDLLNTVNKGELIFNLVFI